MAMLMMPERSQKMPDIAPSVKGVAAISVARSMPVRFMLVPLLTQIRKANAATNTTVQPSSERSEVRRWYSRIPAIKKQSDPATNRVDCEGKEMSVPSISSVKTERSPACAL
jgi:hypothetical protein